MAAQTYPMHGTPPGDSSMGLQRPWPQQTGVYPSMLPDIGQSNYNSSARGMGPLAPSFPNSGTVTLPNTYNPQMIRSPYTSPYDDSWNNNYDTMAPVPGGQPAWERPTMGFSDYQQHSPSRSDGSASTQVSSLSSPYNYPSPLIKLEQQPELSPFGGRYAFEHATQPQQQQQPKFPGTGGLQIIAPQSQRPHTTSLVSYGHPAEDVKYDFDAYDLESLSLSGDTRMLNAAGQPKRRLTTPEEAVCSCGICGKLFKRSNNLRTHMKTHDERHPMHKCEYGDCSRIFDRKTDLVRHEQSVSLSLHIVSESLLTGFRCT